MVCDLHIQWKCGDLNLCCLDDGPFMAETIIPAVLLFAAIMVVFVTAAITVVSKRKMKRRQREMGNSAREQQCAVQADREVQPLQVIQLVGLGSGP